jgi:hypothetical protein
MLITAMLSVIMLYVIMLTIVMLSVILSFIILCVVIVISRFMLSVVNAERRSSNEPSLPDVIDFPVLCYEKH